MKATFFSYNDLSRLNDYLKLLKIETKLVKENNKNIIYVPKDKYLEVLSLKNLSDMCYGLYWLNINDEPRPINYISVMCCKLPKSRVLSRFENINNKDNDGYPIDIRIYLDKLKKYLNSDVMIIYNSLDNSFEILVESSFENLELIKNKCINFNFEITENPFNNITYLNPEGIVPKSEIVENPLKTYFDNSLLVTGIKMNKEHSIIPKVGIKPFGIGYQYRKHAYDVRSFNISENYPLSITGNFVIYEEKIYDSYIGNSFKCSCKNNPFIMFDNGTFETRYDITENSLILTTEIDLVRNVIGYNFDKRSVRDVIFKIPHEDFRTKLVIKDHYEIIDDKLIHYSDSSDYYEVYEIKEIWKFMDGIKVLGEPKVYKARIDDVKDKTYVKK